MMVVSEGVFAVGSGNADVTATSWTGYDVPFVRAVEPSMESALIVKGLDEATVVNHVDPPSVEYWTSVTALPPFEPSVNSTVSL
jgi:hypothetical protein